MCRSSWNLGASTSWNPQGLSRPVMGLLLPYNINLATTTFRKLLHAHSFHVCYSSVYTFTYPIHVFVILRIPVSAPDYTVLAIHRLHALNKLCYTSPQLQEVFLITFTNLVRHKIDNLSINRQSWLWLSSNILKISSQISTHILFRTENSFTLQAFSHHDIINKTEKFYNMVTMYCSLLHSIFYQMLSLLVFSLCLSDPTLKSIKWN